jgi:hypothetical protein
MASFMAPRYPAAQEREAGAGANQCQGRGGIHRGVSESLQKSWYISICYTEIPCKNIYIIWSLKLCIIT